MVVMNMITWLLYHTFLTRVFLFISHVRTLLKKNGIAERKHRHIIEMVRTTLAEIALPSHFWVDAADYAVYTINRLPTPNLKGISPFAS